MSLLDLPLEHFGEVISWLSLREVAYLWLCGNKSMIWRLSKGKMVRSAQISVGFLPFSRLSGLIELVSQFDGLEELDVSVRTTIWQREFAKLLEMVEPRQLKSLKLFLSLGSEGVFDAFKVLASRAPSPFSRLEYLALLTYRGPISLDFEIPRTLTSLDLGTRSESLDSLSLAKSQFPENLTSLTCFPSRLIVPNDATQFPISLNSLNLSLSFSCYVPLFPLIPPNCENLTLRVLPRYHVAITNDEWNALSQVRLKYLDLNFECTFGSQQAKYLPRTLDAFHLNRVSMVDQEDYLEVLQAMPQNLRILTGFRPTLITAEIAQAMPRSLETCSHEIYAPEALQYLPNGIKKICLAPVCDVQDIQGFPSQLENLSIPSLTLSIASMLPSTLLALHGTRKAMVLTEEIIKALPRNLRKIQVFEHCTHPLDSVESLKYLPPKLTILNIMPGNSDRDMVPFVPLPTPVQSASWLSRHLKQLEIGTLDFLEGDMSPWLLTLPPNLETLRLLVSSIGRDALHCLDTFGNLTLLAIATLRAPTDGWASQIKSWPPKLETVTFTDLSKAASNLTNESFRGAPETLTRISIPESSLLDSGCLVHLPNVEHFNVDYHRPKWFLR